MLEDIGCKKELLSSWWSLTEKDEEKSCMKSVLARHYTDFSPEKLKEIYIMSKLCVI